MPRRVRAGLLAGLLAAPLSGCGFFDAGADEPPYFDRDSNRPLTGRVDVGAWTTRGAESDTCLYGWVRPGEQSPAWRTGRDAVVAGAEVTDVRFFLAPGDDGRGRVPHWYVAAERGGTPTLVLLRDEGPGATVVTAGATPDTLRATLPRTAAGCLPI